LGSNCHFDCSSTGIFLCTSSSGSVKM
jgi:hypothetical protein